MRVSCLWLVVLVALSGCGDDNGNGDNKDVLAYIGLEVGKSWEYDVAYQTATLAGKVEVVSIDKEYKDGVDALKVEMRQNQLLIATRWYQVKSEGLFLLGEEVQEQSALVERTFLDPIEIIPYPELGQSWTTTSEMEQGGSETHRFDKEPGTAPRTVPAGTFEEVVHLIHTRTDKDSQSHQYNEYFVPENWLIEFDYPEDSTWTRL
jgi:hypothetical protein